MNEVEKYLDVITQLFLQYGIKSVSMDDVSRELGISKKKLYQIFKDKRELVERSVGAIKKWMIKIVDEYVNAEMNVIEKEIFHRKKYLKTYLRIKPTFIYDLKKFYPELFSGFVSFQSKLIRENTCQLIEEGKNQGLYREDLEPEFIARLSFALTISIFNPDFEVMTEEELLTEKYSDQFFKYHMNGICSEKGRKLFNDLYNKELM